MQLQLFLMIANKMDYLKKILSVLVQRKCVQVKDILKLSLLHKIKLN
jgi:hypothetical protein